MAGFVALIYFFPSSLSNLAVYSAALAAIVEPRHLAATTQLDPRLMSPRSCEGLAYKIFNEGHVAKCVELFKRW